jgi:hypothetical protein
MAFLKERIHRATCSSGWKGVFAALVARLKNENFEIEKEDAGKGRIVVRCESLIVNWIFWRCWSKKLLFEVHEIADGKTAIEVYALPDLFKTSAKKSEPAELGSVISRLALEDL